MASGAADELGKFRRNLERASSDALMAVVGTTLDELIDLLRALGVGSEMGIEMAAALSAELHKRNAAATVAQRSPMVGSA